MKIINKLLVAGVVAAGLSTALIASASAYVACNGDGDCWHTDTRVAVPGVRFDYHPDDWYFHRQWAGDRYHWRDYHEDGVTGAVAFG